MCATLCPGKGGKKTLPQKIVRMAQMPVAAERQAKSAETPSILSRLPCLVKVDFFHLKKFGSDFLKAS